MKTVLSALAAFMLFAAASAASADAVKDQGIAPVVVAALTPVLQDDTPMTPVPGTSKNIQLSEWIGAPCMSDDDCGKYKCDDNSQLCVEK